MTPGPLFRPQSPGWDQEDSAPSLPPWPCGLEPPSHPPAPPALLTHTGHFLCGRQPVLLFIFSTVFPAERHSHRLAGPGPPPVTTCPAVGGVPGAGPAHSKGRGLRQSLLGLLQAHKEGRLLLTRAPRKPPGPSPGCVLHSPSRPGSWLGAAPTGPLPGPCPGPGGPSSLSDRGAQTSLSILSSQGPPPPGSPPGRTALSWLLLSPWQFSTSRTCVSSGL